MALKGVVLAGGSGSRLLRLTLVTNKHLLSVLPARLVSQAQSFLGERARAWGFVALREALMTRVVR